MALSPAQHEFQQAKHAMQHGLLERDEEIHICLTALVCEEHALFVGSPGTAKSMLVETLANWCGEKFFSLLVNKFTTPEEMFGPLDIQALKQGKYQRITTSRLPEAGIAFLDEIFKASSAILNTTLRILNERRYDNGLGDNKVPLQMCLAASNEWPGADGSGQELAAVFDRFLFRRTVQAVKKPSNRERLLWDQNLDPNPPKNLEASTLNQARQEMTAMKWDKNAKEAVGEICRDLAREGIVPGDRRLRKAIRATQASAWVNGHQEVEKEDLSILSHILWNDPLEQPKKAAEVVEKIANPGKQQVMELVGQAEEILANTNPSDLASATRGCKALEDIQKKLHQLGKIGSDAHSNVTEGINDIRRAAMSGMSSLGGVAVAKKR